MTWLIAGIVVFFGIHLFPTRISLREKLVLVIEEMPYKVTFALLSFAGLGLMIKGMGAAPYTTVWYPPAVATTVTAVFMAPALILLVAMKFDNNIKRIVRHPMMWGVLLWSLSHLFSNARIADLLLFGSFAVYALFHLYLARQRTKATGLDQDHNKNERPEKRLLKKDVLACIIGLIVYFLLIAFHNILFGVAINQ